METQLKPDRISGMEDGWMPSGESWIFGSSDSPIFELNIPGDKTGKYSKGMKLKLEQSQAFTSLWDFTANANDGIGSNNGTEIGSPTFTSGKFSTNALTLNGTSQCITMADSSSLKPIGDFTVGLWVKCIGAERSIFASRNTSVNINGFVLYVDVNGKLLLQVGNNTGLTEGQDYWNVLSNTSVNDDVWHYIVVTVKDVIGQLYIDGNLDASGFVIPPNYTTINYPVIGALNDGSGNMRFFSGQIQDLFLINGCALDEKTIYDKYVSNTPQGAPTLALTKNFIIHDVFYSSPNTTLTIYGGTDFVLSNGTISNPYYSIESTPFGFNKNPDKWSLTITDILYRGQASPVVNTAYNLGGFEMVVPIGAWKLYLRGNIGAQWIGHECACFAGLCRDISINIIPEFLMCGAAYQLLDAPILVKSVFHAPVKTQLFMVVYTNRSGQDSIFIDNALSSFIFKAMSVYI